MQFKSLIPAAIPRYECRPSPSFDNKGKVSYSSSPSLTNNDVIMNISPFPDNRLMISTTLSYAMRLINPRVSKHEETPMILFDEHGGMHTNYYPPVAYHRSKNRQKTDVADAGSRRYWPKWSCAPRRSYFRNRG